RPKNFEGELMDLLYTASEKAKMTMTELQNYDKIMYTELDRLAQLEYAREEGESKGRAEGREEGSNARAEEIARKMKEMGFSPEQIKQATGIEL
ncbi:MAG: hypothetical protein IJU13_04290, partial [Bacteroidales bacterium]|nr:hypothetical protein [Bacteroidales bacterium]